MKYGLETFETCLFKVTRPNEFNDPYDCIGYVTGNLRPEVLSKFIDENFKRICEAQRSNPEVPEDAFSSPEMLKSWYGPRFGKIARNQMLYRTMFDEQLRILCLVDKDGLGPESDALMWSHYADGGKGVRIEVEFPDEGSGYPYGMRHVKYAKVAPSLNLEAIDRWPESEAFKGFFEECIWTKSLPWRYENEVRMIFSPQYPTRVIVSRSCDDGIIRDFVGCSRGCIKGLVFGPKVVPNVWMEKYARYRKDGMNGHVVFQRAVLETDRYCYGYENLDELLCEV